MLIIRLGNYTFLKCTIMSIHLWYSCAYYIIHVFKLLGQTTASVGHQRWEYEAVKEAIHISFHSQPQHGSTQASDYHLSGQTPWISTCCTGPQVGSSVNHNVHPVWKQMPVHHLSPVSTSHSLHPHTHTPTHKRCHLVTVLPYGISRWARAFLACPAHPLRPAPIA